jgi:hypothetical protein
MEGDLAEVFAFEAMRSGGSTETESALGAGVAAAVDAVDAVAVTVAAAGTGAVWVDG